MVGRTAFASMQTWELDSPSREQAYRHLANRLRTLANRVRFHETKIQLQAIADGFDRLADHVAKTAADN